MNIIQIQAKEFHRHKYGEVNNYQEYIQELRWQLDEYNKVEHKLEFIYEIRRILRTEYDKHLEKCKFKDGDRMKCSTNSDFENTLFFVQNEIDELEDLIPASSFSLTEQESISTALRNILSEIDQLKLGQQISYDDLVGELDELKEL